MSLLIFAEYCWGYKQKKLFAVIDIFHNPTNRFNKEKISGVILSGYVINFEEVYNG